MDITRRNALGLLATGSAAATLALIGKDLDLLKEDAYQMDYGATAAKYIEVFFQNVNRDEVNRRFERGQKALAAMKA